MADEAGGNLADLLVKLHIDISDIDQLARVTGELATLQAQGLNLSEAMDRLASAVEATNAPMTEVGAAASAAAEQLGLFSSEMQIPYEDAAGQLNLFTTELEPIGPAATDAAAGVQEVGGATQEAAKGTNELSAALGESTNEARSFLKEMFEFAGIALTLEKLKETFIETFQEFAKEERAGEAFAVLLKTNKEGTEAFLSTLHNLANELAEDRDKIRDMAQQMLAFGFSVNKIPDALRAAVDASRATGVSFDSVSSSMERMVLSGMLNARMLVRLGISMDDVAKAMNVAANDAPKMFKAMEQSERLEVTIAALEKFKGTGEATSKDLMGAWQDFKNSNQDVFESIGGQLASAAHEFLDWAGTSIQEIGMIVSHLIEFGREIGNLPGIVKEALGLITVAFAANPMAAAALSVLQLALATAGYRDTAEKTAETEKKEQQSLGVLFITLDRMFASYPEFTAKLRAAREEWTQGVTSEAQYQKALNDLVVQFRSLHPAAVQAAEDNKKAHEVPYEQMKVQIDAEAAHAHALVAQNRITYETMAKDQGLTQAQMADQLKKFEADDLAITTSAINRKLALEKTSGEVQKDLTLGAQLTAARDKAAEEDLKIDQKTADEKLKIWEQSVKDHVATLNKELAFDYTVRDHVQKLNDEMVADREKADQLEEQGNLRHQTSRIETERSVGAAEVSAHQITVFEKMDLDDKLDAEEDALQRRSLQRELDILNSKTALNTKEASQRMAILNQIQALEDRSSRRTAVTAINDEAAAWRVLGIESDQALKTQVDEAAQALDLITQMGAPIGTVLSGEKKLLELEIQRKTQLGETADAEKLALAEIEHRQSILIAQTESWGDVLAGLLRTYDQMFGKLSEGLASGLTDIQNFGSTMINVLKSIEKEILNNLIGFALDKLKAAIGGLGGGGLGGILGGILGGVGGVAGTSPTLAATTANTAATTANSTAIVANTGSEVTLNANIVYLSGIETLLATTMNVLNTTIGVLDAAIVALTAAVTANTAAVSAGGALSFLGGLFSFFAPVPMMQEGGSILETGAAIVHSGEIVLNPLQSMGYRSMMAGGNPLATTAAGVSGDHFDFRGANFYGVTQSLVDDVMNKMVKSARRVNAKI